MTVLALPSGVLSLERQVVHRCLFLGADQVVHQTNQVVHSSLVLAPSLRHCNFMGSWPCGNWLYVRVDHDFMKEDCAFVVLPGQITLWLNLWSWFLLLLWYTHERVSCTPQTELNLRSVLVTTLVMCGCFKEVCQINMWWLVSRLAIAMLLQLCDYASCANSKNLVLVKHFVGGE